MTRRRRKTLFLLLAIAFAALAFWFTRSHEPKYQCKTLTYWLKQKASLRDEGDSTDADAAIVKIGTNALPFLLEMLQTRDSQWKLKFNDWAHEVFGWSFRRSSAAEKWEMAMAGFAALGPIGEPAVPELAKIARDADESIRRNALLILGQMRTDSAVLCAIPSLTNANPSTRADVAWALGYSGSKGAKAVLPLVASLGDSNSDIRSAAARSLGQIGLYPEIVVPALTNKLTDSDRRVRVFAAFALAAFGTNALAALPMIERLSDETTNSSPRRRFSIPRAIIRIQCEIRDGGIVRGPKAEKKIALVFTGHEFAEGGETILDQLRQHQAHASFFLTGTFLENPNHKKIIERIVEEKHYLGPHSDKHLLYCAWEDRNKTLLTRDEFLNDLRKNCEKILRFREYSQGREFFLPPFEHYNREIADWSRFLNRTLINFTPGTRSNADYTGEADKNFVSSQKIFDNIVKHEQEYPDGLNGFILLLHIGAGPNRADKFHNRFGELLDYLSGKGYQFVRVDELLEPKDDGSMSQRQFPSPNALFRRR